MAICIKFINKIPLKNSKFRKIVEYLISALFYGVIVRISLECYIELLVSAYMNAKHMVWSFSGEAFGSFVSLFQVFFLVAAPFAYNLFLNKYRWRI
jgi:hypothetical protein